MDWPNDSHVVVFTDADNFEPEEPIKKAAALDKWEGEDEDEDVKVQYRDEHSVQSEPLFKIGHRLYASC